jgi:hypothetical protein
MSAISGYNTSLLITSGSSLSLTDEAMTDNGDHKTFTVTNSAHRFLDPNASYTIQTAPDGTTWSTVTTGFVIYYGAGAIVFANAVSGGTPSCRIHAGNYFASSLLGFANSCDISLTNDFVDTTSFSTTGTPIRVKTWTPTLQTATFKLHKWWIDNTFQADLNAGTLIGIATQFGQTVTQRIGAWMYLKQDDVKAMVSGVVEESLDLQTTGATMYVG